MAMPEVHSSRQRPLLQLRASFVECITSQLTDQTMLQIRIVMRMEGLAVSLSMALNISQVCILIILSSSNANIMMAHQMLSTLYVTCLKQQTEPADISYPSIFLGYPIIR